MKPYKLPKLNDRGGNLSQRWYVYYSFMDRRTGKFKLFKKYISSKLRSERARREHAYELIDLYKTRLIKGWNPLGQDDGGMRNVIESFDKAAEVQNAHARRNTELNAKFGQSDPVIPE